MTDEEQIRQLTARYNLAFDTRDVESFVACFTEDCTFLFVTSGRRLDGHAAMRNAVETVDNQGRHHTTDFIIEVDGDRATQRCQLIELGVFDDFAVVRRFGRYFDELVRIEGVWRFRSRELTYG